MATEIGKAFNIAGDTVWTEVAPGNRRAVLAQRPELMLVAFSFEKGAIGALHSHPHTQVSYVAEGSLTSPSTASPPGSQPAPATSSPQIWCTASWP